MSSILNALKKLEQERRRETRRNSNLPLDSAILQESQTPEQRRSPSTALLLTGALVLFLGGAGLVSMYQRTTRQATPATPAAPLIAPTVIPKTAPVVAAPPHKKETAKPVTTKTEKQSPAAKPLATGTQTPTQPASPIAPSAHRPSLKVLGIAYQAGDVSSSIAIVNGTPVSVGGIVEGARVEEIQKDRVRFSLAGERFEVLLAR